MFVRDLYLDLHEVVTVNNNQSVQDVYDTLKKSGYRCIPVVNEEGHYKGMVYKVHVMEDIYENNGAEKNNIDHLLKHHDLYIHQRSPFLNALLEIKALPFISVVEDGKLIGILTHNKVESVLEDAFGLHTGGINITISSIEAKGMIEKLTKTLRGENIEGMFTLDNGSVVARRVVITLESGKSEAEIQDIKDRLENNGFRILHIDYLESRQ
ncbi:CBS domain-containing protein [Sporosarcina ureilytica]|uniref:CBS domain-containing protein n=1 Tax=Sporosarcina ureilytica TaxID=298596 RepID=A0A1D8JCH3_9BACL|nr:CBS domain-containing protein [Sporosarcina ureilytica]AOV06403.1 hypothetical protein BI350_01455 [Sporosarcina ureilytica]